MENIRKLKSKFNLLLLTVLMLCAIISVFVLRSMIQEHSIENATVQARQMSNQLLIMRKYLASIAPKIAVLDKHINQFAIAPAYVGGQVSDGMLKDYDFYIKQTSLKYRNPKNKPDEYEQNILKQYETNILKGEFSEVTLHDGEKSLRYSRPLYIDADCMKCHGKPYVDVPADVYKKLVDIYGDNSFNYKIGDLRGTISISIPMKYIKEQNAMLLKSLLTFILIIFILLLLYIYLERKFIFEPQVVDMSLKEEYEKTVIESNNNAIIAIDWTAKITTYNKKAEDVFGWSKEEMIGTRNLFKIIPKKYKKLHGNASQKYLKTGKTCGVIDGVHELDGLRKDGSIFPLQISFGAKWKPKGAIVVASIVDISKEKEQTQMLVQQSKMASMGEMIGNIAHQWRQPLSAISSSASGAILEKELGLLSDDELTQKLTGIVDKSQFLSQTIEDFRNFFKQSKDKEQFEVNQIINNVQNIVGATLSNHSIVINKDYEKDIEIYCNGFANELSQVIINIFNNAKDVILEKANLDKIIQISLIKNGNNITIKIYDSAGGIPEDVLPKVFEPYFTTKHQSQGTGIGLYMSSEIIGGHFNGKLTAYNSEFKVDDKEYFGACFEISIPDGL